ncbi:MAG: protein tyrosine phosphatase [Chloroflexi bacterium]|nr:protein tyrosine phosphatase [Chloroflexota bacterium]
MPYIDLLTHILPGTDDGPATMDQSVRMAQVSAADGAATLVSTPHHADVQLNSSLDTVRQLLADLNSRLRREAADGAPLVRVVPGMENRITPALPDMIEAGDQLTLNGSRFVLLSTPFATLPDFVGDVLARLRMKRLIPVLARPERNAVLRRDLGRMRAMIEEGTLFVVTAGSITGQFGKDSQRAALRMVQQHLAHAVVSDMHSLDGSRPPGLRRAFRWVERATDEATAIRLLEEQPRMILQGHSPESEPDFDDSESSGRRWWRIPAPGILRGRKSQGRP